MRNFTFLVRNQLFRVLFSIYNTQDVMKFLTELVEMQEMHMKCKKQEEKGFLHVT